MGTKIINVALPDSLKGFVERAVKGGRYQDSGEVVREALRRVEATELADEIGQFGRAFSGGHERAENEEDVQRVEAAVRAGRKS